MGSFQDRVTRAWDQKLDTRSRPSMFVEVVSVVDCGDVLSSCQPGEVYPHREQCKASVLLRQTICSLCPPMRQRSRFTASGILRFTLTGDQRITTRTLPMDRPIGPPRREY